MEVENTGIENDLKSDVIQPINRNTVHRICSGQVVLSLAIAVKELVENAIDAKATQIDVRLKEYGSELAEVADNGTGVRRENFQALTLKHHTSKIRDFSDLECVETLGFRGEALSSLCALSDLSIVTKHFTADIATKIVYDHNGLIVSEEPSARLEGTTVSLANLFSTLPVRRKEFLKNLRRDFSKMCQLLYAYCLVWKGVRFSCTNQLSKGSINSVLKTEGAMTIRENIVNVFGAKQISTLIDVEIVHPDETILKEYSLTLVPGEKLPFSLEFCISSVMYGYGRSSADRQFYYINSRPCEPTKIMKLVNQVYKQFNAHQYPFVFLNIIMEKSQIDVNVTPDKRQIFLAKEKLLSATIKMSLMDAFKTFPSTYKIQNVGVTKLMDVFRETSQAENDSVKTCNKGIKRFLTEPTKDKTDIQTGCIFETFKKRSKMDDSSIKETKSKTSLSQFKEENEKEKEISDESHKNLKTLLKLAYTLEQEKKENVVHVQVPNKNQARAKTEIKNETFADDSDETVIALDEEVEVKVRKTVALDVSINDVRKALDKINLATDGKAKQFTVKFRSKISPEANATAEKELEKQISKCMFKAMEIIGQFNHGFIITKLNDDLFIIDQHATDEKYNFEQLQITTVLENQVLVNPKPLELTAANESMLIENEEIFKKNGFKFKIDHEAECTKKVFLTAIPVSKNVVFGKDDIDEMLFMIKDSNCATCRPSRIRTMFASRACRKSVMVGHPLTHSDMRRLVDHMGEIEQPWNCPHGRPTMRHLINLNLIHKE